jgi:hypothetical protein
MYLYRFARREIKPDDLISRDRVATGGNLVTQLMYIMTV